MGCTSSEQVTGSRPMVRSPRSRPLGMLGNGGTYMWADPEREVVGVYLSVSPRVHRD